MNKKQLPEWIRALILWGAFVLAVIIIHGTIPFVLGADMRAWVYSPAHILLVGLLGYGILFTAIPLICIKGWQTVRQPAFLIPLLLTVAAFALFDVLRGIAVVGVLALAYLHRRYDLSDYGIRSNGWKGDLLAILFLSVLSILPSLFRPLTFSSPSNALLAGLDRMFANPASTAENLFYFGFVTERLSHKTGKWLTPFLVGLMYVAHEMTNPEYWYEGMSFGIIFIVITVAAFFYLWRRSVVVLWLGDGLSWFARALLG